MKVTFNDDAYFRGFVDNIPDYPKPGIVFRDIQPLLQSSEAFDKALDLMANWTFQHLGNVKPKALVGIESRGFIFGAALARYLDCGFVMCRKAGKLPGRVEAATYSLEYGQATLELGRNSIRSGANYVVVDDVLATGGTARACVNLIRALGGEPKAVVSLIELSWLKPQLAVLPVKTFSLINYSSPGL